MAAIEVLLSTPTDDIVECPNIGPEEARAVAGSLEALFNKCLYCTRLKLPLPLEVLLTVVADAGEGQADKVCAGVLQPADEGTCADLFCELTTQLLSRKAASFRLQFDIEVFFKVVQLFCSSATLKSRIGASLSDVLLRYMRDIDAHSDDYRVHRNCCSALISLLRGSPANKARIGPECATVAACLEDSSDFFFQMQCVEVLYRLYKQTAAYLTEAPCAKTINPYLLRGIEELPNDGTLLLSIHQLLDNYNRDVHADRIVSFAVLQIAVDGVEVSRATTLYFSPLLLVVLLPGGHGGYLTIPYEHIRSVKLSKDHKLELRLYVVPSKLSLLMSLAENENRDRLQISLTRATMRELRTSVVHQWVADRKRSAPRRVVQQRQEPRLVQVTATSAVGSSSSNHVDHTSTAPRPTSQRTSRASSAHPPHIGERPVNVPPLSNHSNHISPSKSNPAAVEVERETRQQRLTDMYHHASGSSGSLRHQSSSRQNPAAASAGINAEDVGGEGAETEAEEENYLSEVHRAASVKAVRYRAEQQEHLQHAVDAVKSELEDLHRCSCRERDQYEANFREDMQVVRRSEAVLKESAAECVQALNSELDDVQALGALLKAEVDRLRERMAKALGKSEGVEEAFLVRMKQSVDTSMKSLETTLLSVEAASSTAAGDANGSLDVVTQYIAEQMQAISSGAITPGAVRGANVRPFSAPPPPHVKSRRLDYS